jgi:hypothetical protein
VIFWYRVFTLGRSPVVIIDAAQGKFGEQCTDLSNAVRTLVENYKLRVLVYGTTNYLPLPLFRTMRQLVFDIKPMTKEMIWKMGQLQDLFRYIKGTGLEDTVFAVLGGIPSEYDALWYHTKEDLQNGKDAKEVIGNHVCAQIYSAIKEVQGFCENEKKNVSTLIKVFQEADVLTECTLIENGFQATDRIFREEDVNGVPSLIPASNAIGIVLRHNLKREPSLVELEELLKLKSVKMDTSSKFYE